MSLQGWQPHGGQPYGQSSTMRASDADRERACDVLKAGFAEGRLRQEEFEDRLARAQRAGTYGELQGLVADLPQGPVHQPPQQAFYGPARPMPIPMPLPPPTNGNATGALVCGLLTLFTGGATAIPAVILGHKARAEIRRTGEQGDGQAVTGLVFGYLSIAAWVALILTIVLLLA